tara:strand:+ start:706 stop:990 length:285 start_codon:yes stop_codon:yes gene_type:complete
MNFPGMMICTEFIGPTGTKGERIKATHHRDSGQKFSKTIGFDYNYKTDERWMNHQDAAQALIDSWPMNEFGSYTLQYVGYDHLHNYFVALRTGD